MRAAPQLVGAAVTEDPPLQLPVAGAEADGCEGEGGDAGARAAGGAGGVRTRQCEAACPGIALRSPRAGRRSGPRGHSPAPWCPWEIFPAGACGIGLGSKACRTAAGPPARWSPNSTPWPRHRDCSRRPCTAHLHHGRQCEGGRQVRSLVAAWSHGAASSRSPARRPFRPRMRPFNSREKDMKSGRCIRMIADVRFAAAQTGLRPAAATTPRRFPDVLAHAAAAPTRRTDAANHHHRPRNGALRERLPLRPATLTSGARCRTRSTCSRSTSRTTPSTRPPRRSVRSRPCGRTLASAS